MMSATAFWTIGFLHLLVACVQSSVSDHSAANFSVIGPANPIVDTFCEDVVLPCQLSPDVTIKDMEVRWTKLPSGTLVHLYRNGTDDDKDQNPDYQGRTELIKDILTGRVEALMIRNVSASDGGSYHCQFHFGNVTTGRDLVLEVKEKSACELQRELDQLKAVNRDLSTRVETMEKQLERNWKELEWRKGRYTNASVMLDPDTAHPQLIVSEDQKSVRFSETPRNVTDSPKRFSNHPCVLGSEGYQWHNVAWEADMGDVGEWSVGAVPASVDPKWDRMMDPERKFWAIYMVENPDPSMTPRPRRIGLFLDSQAKQLHIYNAETMDRIWSFFVTDEKIFPLFCIFSAAEIKLWTPPID
ncbi:butyrophilin subfamily 1 member A1-like isoform X1 [Pleurodeles waltl]